MVLSFLTEYAVPVIVGICLCMGYLIKTSLDFIPNKYIPLIMALLGLALNIFMTASFTTDVILGGLFSGLASTGLYEAFRNVLSKKGE